MMIDIKQRWIAEDAFLDRLHAARVAADEAGLTLDRQRELLRGEEQFLAAVQVEQQRTARRMVPPLVLFLSAGWEAEPAPVKLPASTATPRRRDPPITLNGVPIAP